MLTLTALAIRRLTDFSNRGDTLDPTMKKRVLEIGVRVPGTKLVVLGFEPSDSHGNQRVRVRCEWPVHPK